MKVWKLLVAVVLSLAVAAALARWSGARDRWVRSDTSSGGAPAVELTLEADAPVRGWLRSAVPSLVVGCTAAGVDFAVATRLPAAVEPGEDRSVRYQFDGDDGVVTAWTQSANRQFLTAPGDTARGLAQRLAQAERFSFTYIPFNAEPALATFTLTGFAERWRQAQADCGIAEER